MTVSVTPDDLGTYLGNPNLDWDRANALIGYAASLCESVVSPLPDGAEPVVLDVAARAYGNPSNAQQQTTGPFAVSYGQMAGGLWLTRANRATLRRLSGGGGAFTIDTTPAGAGQNLPSWDRSPTDLGWSR